jgi:hypothetical protein
MPTIKPNLMDGKVEIIQVPTVAAELAPTMPLGRQAITIESVCVRVMYRLGEIGMSLI